MMDRPLAALRGIPTAFLLGLNTLAVFATMVPPALVKLLVPASAARRRCEHALSSLASVWVAVNNAWIVAVNPRARWSVRGVDALNPRGWYLVSSNHQTWADILVLQRVFHGHIPFLKFFIKQELIWVPVIGLAWWALDFPFLKRGKGQGARSSDLRTTRAACEKFKRIPTSVINFIEGTRFTPAKHAEQKGPYRHLLKPKIGGLGIALATMGEQFECLLDVTIAYPGGIPSLWDLMCGRVDGVVVEVVSRPIPPEVLGGDPLADKAYRLRITEWVDGQWREKDERLAQLLAPRTD